MVKRRSWLCMFIPCTERRPQSLVTDSYISMNSGVYSKEMMVRIIHAGGRKEVYPNEILVSNLMGKYPGMCVAKPEVFKLPHKSVLSSAEVLLPGQKYFLIPGTTIEKLKRKCSEKTESTIGEELLEFSACSPKDFYAPKENCCKISPKKHPRRKKKFVPPIRRQRAQRSMGWEPSLMSIEEISP